MQINIADDIRFFFQKKKYSLFISFIFDEVPFCLYRFMSFNSYQVPYQGCVCNCGLLGYLSIFFDIWASTRQNQP